MAPIATNEHLWKMPRVGHIQYLEHLRSDSGVDRTYHTQDTVGGVRTGIAMFQANSIFHIRLCLLDQRDAISWVEIDHRQKERSNEVSKEL